MRDSNSEITFEMNTFYPQKPLRRTRGGEEYIPGTRIGIERGRTEIFERRKENNSRREIESSEEEAKYSGAEGNNPGREIELSEEEEKYSREGRKIISGEK